MINDNLKEENINNYDLEKEEQKEVGKNILNNNIKDKNYIGINAINLMSSEIEQLKEALIKANEKINIFIEENNKLKIIQGENMKELSIKEGIIDSNKKEISRLLSKITSYENEEEINKKTIKDLNYKIIEINQQIESKETINKITQKIKNEKPEDLEHNYLIEINELNNKINEIEINNSKLKFDNENLLNKIDIITKEKKTELEIMESLYIKKNEILEKEIERLNEMINDLLNEKQKEHIDIFDYKNIQNDIYKCFIELEEKMKKLNNVNFLIKKENQKLKNENEELSIIINGKETIIEKLQSNINKIENDFKQRLSEGNIINNNESIEQLLNEQKRLTEENDILRNNYEQMTQGINEANELFVSKQKEYENIINAQMEKLKEYKFKISVLKIKVNELHSEIEFLQEKQIKTPINYLSTIEKDKNSLDSNYTPEQMKITGADNTLNIKTDSINNNENN
jgi:chromosome segregation ATPase